MSLKEANLVRMKGVLPSKGAEPIPVGKIPDDGTQVAEDGLAENQVTAFHTVTTGKTFYLTAFTCGFNNDTEGDATGNFYVTNASDAIQYYLAYSRIPANDGEMLACSFPTPVEIAAGWKFKIESPAAGFYIRAFIHGYEM